MLEWCPHWGEPQVERPPLAGKVLGQLSGRVFEGAAVGLPLGLGLDPLIAALGKEQQPQPCLVAGQKKRADRALKQLVVHAFSVPHRALGDYPRSDVESCRRLAVRLASFPTAIRLLKFEQLVPMESQAEPHGDAPTRRERRVLLL